MRRDEKQYVSAAVTQQATRWGGLIKATRLSLNLTQAAAAERARMSKFTWIKIENGDVSVGFSAWLSAMDVLGLLDQFSLPAVPEPPRQRRLRARVSTATEKEYDF